MMYKLIDENTVLRLEDNALIPLPAREFEGYKYEQWLSDGNVPLPADPETPFVPQEVTMRQARLALFEMGKLSLVEDALNSMVEPMKTIAWIEWEYAQSVVRNSPLVNSLASALNLTESEMDQLFILAGTK